MIDRLILRQGHDAGTAVYGQREDCVGGSHAGKRCRCRADNLSAALVQVDIRSAAVQTGIRSELMHLWPDSVSMR